MMRPWVQAEIGIWGRLEGTDEFWRLYPTAILSNFNWKDNQGEADIYGRLPDDKALLDAQDGMTIAVIRRDCGRRDVWFEEEVVLWLRNCKIRWLIDRMGARGYEEENPIPIRLMILECDVEWRT